MSNVDTIGNCQRHSVLWFVILSCLPLLFEKGNVPNYNDNTIPNNDKCINNFSTHGANQSKILVRKGASMCFTQEDCKL